MFEKEYMDLKNNGNELVLSGILSRFPISRNTYFYTSEMKAGELGDIKRGSVYIEIEVNINNKKLTIATDHLSYISRFEENDKKTKEVKELIKIIKRKKADFIFSGDLNAPPNSYIVRQLKTYLNSCGPDDNEKSAFSKDLHDYEGWTTGFEWRLDYVFASKDMKVKSAKIIKTEYSDHLPILVEFEI